MTIAVYPGSFDPVTMGHLDIARRAAALFDRVIVAVYESPPKNLLFTTEERVRLLQEAAASIPNVEVVSFTGLVVEFAQKVGARAIVRGLRMGSDFEREFEMALMNRNMAPEVEVVCLMARIEYQFLSSSLLKEVAKLGGYCSNLVPENVLKALRVKFSQIERSLASQGG
ncbi:MAG: pantetheine-phosphate adenylyltransferase [Chloroflexota bacterium]